MRPRGRLRRPDPSAGGVSAVARGLFASDERLAQGAMFVVFVVTLLLTFVLGEPEIPEKEGAPASRDYVARASFECNDYDQMVLQAERAVARAPHVYELSSGFVDARADVTRALERTGSEAFPTLDAQGRARLAAVLNRLRDRREGLGAILSELEKSGALSRPYYEMEKERGAATVRLLDSQTGLETEIPLSDVMVVSPDNPAFVALLKRHLPDLAEKDAAELAGVLADLLPPVLSLNRERSMAVAREQASQLRPITKRVPAGHTILARGTRVRRQHLEEIAQERASFARTPEGALVGVQRVVGVGLYLGILLMAAAWCIRALEPSLLEGVHRYPAFLVSVVALAFSTRLLYLYALPASLVLLPLWVLALSVAFSRRLAGTMAVFGAFLVPAAGYQFEAATVVPALGGIVISLLAGRARYRSDLIKAGFLGGVIEAVLFLGSGLMESETGLFGRAGRGWLLDAAGAGSIALASGFLISGLLPLIERAFGVTSNIGLLEWSDPNKPLLQRLLKEAPGTYHHSMLVGSLAADAAESIGASALLARVCGYYHDVGKLLKPEYFVENLAPGEPNPHDQLSPTMSALIITAHPRDGVDLAARYGLPIRIRDAILQHHGTTAVGFFLNRARETAGPDHSVSEDAFRYRGPKPQSREIALIHLADSVEAATRSMRDQTFGRIQGKIGEIVMARIRDGQLDDSGLSLTDIHKAQESLARSVSAFFHTRIAYPVQAVGKEHETDVRAQH